MPKMFVEYFLFVFEYKFENKILPYITNTSA